MNKNIQITRLLFVFIVCMLSLGACTDDFFIAEDLSLIPQKDVTMVSGKETEVRLPVAVADIAYIEVSEDFAIPLTDSLHLRLYMEENADETPRTVELHLTMNDGSRQILSYSQGTRAAEGESTMSDFSRTYGVGFSYDAIGGDKCNLRDIKCQILNLKQLRKLEEETSEQLLFNDYKNEMSTSVESSRSFAEYIQKTFFDVSVSGNLILFKGEFAKNMSIAEQGFRNSIYTKAILRKPVVKTWLDYPNLLELLKNKADTPVLTRSFRNAIKRLEKSHTIEEVDAFIGKFGSFIITSSQLGGGLDLVYKTSYDKFRTYQQEKELSSVDILSFFKSHSDTQISEENLKILTTSNCVLSVKGGDAVSLNEAVLNPTFDNPNININQYYKWVNSLRYDESNPTVNNVEITDMQVTPIWDLIQNDVVAQVIRARIEGTTRDMEDMFGAFNFVNTIIKIDWEREIYSVLGGKRVKFDNPPMVNVIANNRYVASICREWVPEIDASEPVYVVYPIYEQQLELASGLCVRRNKEGKREAYRVACKYGQFYVERLPDEERSGSVFMTNGLLSDQIKGTALNYVPNTPVISYEWWRSILQNGTLNPQSQYYTVFKVFDKFYLDKPKTYLGALPNWHFTSAVPAWPEPSTDFIKSKGSDFFKALHVNYTEGENIDNLKGRMIRNDDYFYYWNKLELQINVK